MERKGEIVCLKAMKAYGGNKVCFHTFLTSARSGFGGLEVACWPLVPKFAGSHPIEDVAFLRSGSKAVGPML
jgi:hypothetical protein